MRTLEDVIKEYEKFYKEQRSISLFDDRYNEIQLEKNKLTTEYRELLSDNKKLALYLHTKLCHNDHTCGCSFFYEKKDNNIEDDWLCYEHLKYLSKADAMLKISDYNSIINILNFI